MGKETGRTRYGKRLEWIMSLIYLFISEWLEYFDLYKLDKELGCLLMLTDLYIVGIFVIYYNLKILKKEK